MIAQRWDDAFEQLVRPFLGLLAEGDLLPGDVSLVNLGLDSLNAVQLLFALEDHYGLDLAEELLGPELFSSPTVLWSAISSMRIAESGGI